MNKHVDTASDWNQVDPARPQIADKTMILSCGLPPAMNGSSSVIANLAISFTCDELVLVGERVDGALPDEWKRCEPSRVDLMYVHHQWPWRFKRLVRLLMSPLILFRLLRAYRKTGCKQIITVFPNEFYLCLGLITSVIVRCPFYSYFHNTYAENRRGFKFQFARLLQWATFKRSRVVFVMSNAIREMWQESYPQFRFVTLVHTFAGNQSYRREKGIDMNSVRVGVMGNVNESNREAFSRLPAVIEQFPNIHLTICSKLPASYFMSFGFNSACISIECPPDPIESTLAKFDLLFLPHGFSGNLSDVEYMTIFPTRTIPYLRSGTPIVAHTPPGAFITDWLRQNDCAEVVEIPTVDAICEAIDRLLSNEERRHLIVTNAINSVEQFQSQRVAGQLASVLNAACK